MTLKGWEENKWLVRHETSKQEVADLLAVVERNLADSNVPGLSSDRQYATAYEAALQLGTLALAVSGYRCHKGAGSHYYTIQSLTHTVKLDDKSVRYLDAARRVRNEAEYLRAGLASPDDADEMRDLARRIQRVVIDWIRVTRKDLL